MCTFWWLLNQLGSVQFPYQPTPGTFYLRIVSFLDSPVQFVGWQWISSFWETVTFCSSFSSACACYIHFRWADISVCVRTSSNISPWVPIPTESCKEVFWTNLVLSASDSVRPCCDNTTTIKSTDDVFFWRNLVWGSDTDVKRAGRQNQSSRR